METQNAFFENVALWSQVLGAVAFFVVLILLFRKYLIPAVKANQDARNAEIAETEARLARMQAEGAKARGELERADQDAAQIRARMAGTVRADREHILAEAKADGERLVHNAEGELERARLAARDRLRVEFIEKALVQARAQASSRVSADLDGRLVESTVDALVRGNS